MTNSLYYKIKDTVDAEKHYLLELFFKDWVDESCNNQVNYKFESRKQKNGSTLDEEVLRVDFETQEDAVILTLKGIPVEFQDYLEIVKSST
jgi:hypothetical protein